MLFSIPCYKLKTKAKQIHRRMPFFFFFSFSFFFLQPQQTQHQQPQMTDQLPFFVYGTLQEGFGNWSNHLEGKTTAIRATIHGFDCYHFNGFPGIFPQEGEIERKSLVKGELHSVIDASRYDSILRGLDWLEDWNPEDPKNSMYRRVKHLVRQEEGDGEGKEVLAWVYICQIDVGDGEKLVAEEGGVLDWGKFMRNGGHKDEVDPFKSSSSSSSSSFSSSGGESN